MTNISLQTIEEKLLQAQQKLKLAENAVEVDKASRTGFFSQLVDFVIDTKAEKEHKQEQEKFEAVAAECKAQTLAWIDQKTVELINTSPSDNAIWSDLRDRRQNLETILAPISKTEEQGRSALIALDDAAVKCNTAWWSEMGDALSSNKLMSFASSMDTSSAKNAVHHAYGLTQTFQQSINEQKTQAGNHFNLELADLFIDMTFAPVIDFVSMANMNKLDAAERECKEQYNRLVEPYKAIKEKCNALGTDISELSKQMHAVEQKYRPLAEVGVPSALREFIVHNKPVDLDSLPSTNLGVNTNAGNRYATPVAKQKNERTQQLSM